MIALVIGATRGLGRRVAEQYVSMGATVFGTARKQPEKDEASKTIKWISGIDVATPAASETIIKSYKESLPIDVLVVSAGYFGKESFDEPDWHAEEMMYKTSAIGPVFLVTALAKAGLLKQGSKVVMISSEAGSISLRHEKEGGGNYGHHASKAALNMVTKLLSLDLKPKGIPIVAVHPGFMRTEMTKNIGFDQYWDSGGAVTPEEAAKSLVNWVDNEVDMSKTGQFWAPRGPRDIGTADVTMGPVESLPTPLQLPW